MVDFLSQAHEAAKERARAEAQRKQAERERVNDLAARIVALPDESTAFVMEVLQWARRHYRDDPLGIQKAEADLKRIKAAGPDEHGVLGTMATDEEFED